MLVETLGSEENKIDVFGRPLCLPDVVDFRYVVCKLVDDSFSELLWGMSLTPYSPYDSWFESWSKLPDAGNKTAISIYPQPKFCQ